MEQTYQVLFSGKLLDGFNIAQVKKNLALIFKKTPQQVDALFSGKAVIIKNNVDKQTAAKYQAVLKKAGAACEIKLLDGPTKEKTGTQAPAPVQAAAAASATTNSAALSGRQDIINISIPDNTGGFTIAAPGEILGEIHAIETMEIGDISTLSIAELGAILSNPEEHIKPTAKIADISHLTLEKLD